MDGFERFTFIQLVVDEALMKSKEPRLRKLRVFTSLALICYESELPQIYVDEGGAAKGMQS